MKLELVTRWILPILLAAGVMTMLACGTPSEQSAEMETGELPVEMVEGQDAASMTEAQAPSTEAAAPSTAKAPTRTAPAPTRTAPAPTRPAPAPSQPAPPPAPSTVTVRLPAGTLIDVELADSLSSGTNLAGDSFRARVVSDVTGEGKIIIPVGSVVFGEVTEVVSVKSKKIGGKAKMQLSFNRVDLPSGGIASITAFLSEEGKSETKKDAATIGGATAAGAILGREIKDKDRDKGALIGAIVGAAAGTAIAAKTEGKEIELPAGTIMAIELGAPVDVDVPR